MYKRQGDSTVVLPELTVIGKGAMHNAAFPGVAISKSYSAAEMSPAKPEVIRRSVTWFLLAAGRQP